MAASTVTVRDVKKIQREIAQLKRRVEKLEKKKTTRRSAVGKKNGANGHRARLRGGAGRTTRSRKGGKIFKPDARLRSLLGAVTLGYPTGSDNESIDRDLALEYGSTHEAQ
ncbi:MAG: hypothetical protein HY741_29700 [Chloroflexi bacterium]|nr:hypothetical protein [Chloroflexota bacterium]